MGTGRSQVGRGCRRTESPHWTGTGKVNEVIKANGSKTSYVYDADGNRLVRKDPSGATVYLPGTELKLSADGTKKETTRYYGYAGQTVAVRTAAKVSFVASDHHGTGELAIDSVTGAISQRRFDPFGVDRGEKTGVWPGEKGYVGGTIDASTGLTHLGAREYDSAIGKFISVDPVIDYTQPQQINGYAYANNSPVTHADPSGMIVPECREGLIECRGGITVTNADPEVSKAQSDVSKASSDVAVAQQQQQQASARQRIKSAGKALIKIARDILGVDAALDCISSGDVGACGETLLNIAGSFAGGLAGKILAKYGAPWKWAKGIKLAKRVTGLVKDMIGGVKGLWNANKAVGRAKLGLSKAAEKLAEVRKKAAAALKKRKKLDEPECHSFLPGTKVLLANGSSKAIEKVKLGDKVVVTDAKTGKTTVREVAGTIVTQDDKSFADPTIKGRSGKPEALIATITHPFWVASKSAWIKAGDLRPGMRLRTPSGDTVELTAVRHFEQRQRTHDLTITGIHSYYVAAGSTPVLVHNCDTLELKYKEGWDETQRAEADAKVAHLNQLAEDGKLVKTKSVRIEKGSAASRLRKAGTTVPDGYHGDHLQDLQLGGTDTLDNLGPLDGSVNSSLGSQIAGKIKNLPMGTRICSVTICDPT
ncbi:polymorphic toxin-type HINT domain-containing protein [Streptomyces sp. NBC_00704]|uniref:polymorphic toxin-type HINT domain-containing protein n=1 Tax=Streptomyces sp. NBC_00704 TaxID=2975809 RepID=UPI002E33754E|nr:polymorphic toxin-type HINT domain-containing protein [Streptomyces sp. NBC_00704]